MKNEGGLRELACLDQQGAGLHLRGAGMWGRLEAEDAAPRMHQHQVMTAWAWLLQMTPSAEEHRTPLSSAHKHIRWAGASRHLVLCFFYSGITHVNSRWPDNQRTRRYAATFLKIRKQCLFQMRGSSQQASRNAY